METKFSMLRLFLAAVLLVGSVFGQWNPNFAVGKFGIVHLFEWHWNTIAEECESLLAPNKIGGVQISPPTENRIVDTRPWWERYQPISYDFTTRSGKRQDLINMIDRCNAVGVRIYPDIVINHMCRGNAGNGTGGTYFNAETLDFPGVPYGPSDFHAKCEITNYNDPWQVRNCRLQDLVDLNQRKDYVRGKIVDMMNDLIGMGVAGFRVDACKHMDPVDLGAIFGSLKNLNSDIYGSGKRAYIYQEVIDQGGEPIKATDYTDIGSVTEFKYGLKLGSNKESLQYLSNFGESWGMMNGFNALAFINNHDNQRGHGGGGDIITFKEPHDLKLLTAFMLAWPYGVPRVMSSYYFSNGKQGPPSLQRSVNADGSCGNEWVCEHRWRQIKNMFSFSAAVVGTAVNNWWTNNNNQIAFSRANKGFIALNNAGFDMNENLNTGLPDGSYCNVISGDFHDGKCAGWCVVVNRGKADIKISASGDPILAIHVDAMTNECNAGGGVSGRSSNGGETTTPCTDCSCPSSAKVDCASVGIDKSGCQAKGCLWCENPSNAADPWCFYSNDEIDRSSESCDVQDDSKKNCGYIGIDKNGCEDRNCCWAESTVSGVPWCFSKA